MTTGYVYDPIYLEHDLPGHPENKRRLETTMHLLEERGLLQELVNIPATPIALDLLQGVHAPDYIDQVRRIAERGGGYLDLETYIGPRSYQAALIAAGGVVNALEAVLDGKVDNAFALVRPPGHHATRERGMGFCLLNNIAVAARYAMDRYELERILIVDFDVHHGNGTQSIFYREQRVLYFSIHQYPFYPGTGHWSEAGEGTGRGFTVNVPLPAEIGEEGYEQVFAELLYPLTKRYRPQLILVSAGYDGHWADPLAGMQLSISGYARLTEALKHLAEETCRGRLAFVLEGGYELEVLSWSVLATFQALLGQGEINDPLGPAPRPSPPIDKLIESIKTLHGLE